MARNRQSRFGVDEDLFGQEKKPEQEVQQVQEVQEVHQVQEAGKEIGTTQGKKGQKLKRINMAFSDLNYEYITGESRRRGMSATAFVNQIIAEYRGKVRE
jgi:hypothetical protein